MENESRMKCLLKIALAALCSSSLMVSGKAAVITWGNAITITNDTDISTNGSFEYGGYFASSAATITINGVIFTGSGGSHNFGANITTAFASGGTAYAGMGAGTGLSANYQTLLGGCVYGSTNNNSITLNNLKIGGQYTIQLWINDSRSNGANSSNTVTSGNSVNLDYNNKNAVGGVGQYTLGTFIADYPSLTFYLQSHQSGQFNALQLRSLPATAASLATITNVSVSVNTTQSLRMVDRRLFALNTAIYDASLSGSASIPLLYEMANQALRWPGGGYGDSWLLSTEAQRPSSAPRLTNFLYIIKSTGAAASMIANYGSGTPADAASLVAACNLANKVYCQNWEIGNETFGTWERDQIVPPFYTNDILNLPSLANKLYTPTNNLSVYLRSQLSAATLVTLTNYMGSASSYGPALATALVGDINNVVNNISPFSIYKQDTNRFAGVTFRALTWTNLALPIPNAGQDLNNRMTLEDAYPELAQLTPAVNLATNWPNIYLPHDPWTYAQRFAQYYTQMKAVDPTIKIGALAVPNETSYGNGYTQHFAVNPRTGVTSYGWTPVMLASLKSLGVMPDALIYHNYAVSGDAALLQWSSVLTNDSAALRQMLADYYSPAASNIDLCITEMGPDISDQSSTSLVGGLFYADNSGWALQSGFSERLWWSFRNGAGAVAANTNIYGWRNVADYGMVAGSGSPVSNRYPDFYCFKLTQYFARGGEAVLPVTNSSLLLATYAVKQTNGALRLLVVNKSATLNINGNFALPGYVADGSATAYSYGMPQDEMVRTNGPGLTDIAVTNFTLMSPSAFSYAFAPYSATVIVLSPPALPVTKQYQTRITFTNYLRGEILTNFPVLVVLRTNLPGFDYHTFASATGGDLRFESGDDTTELNYEIEQWNPGGNSYVWVQVPRFTNYCSVLAQWGGFNGSSAPAYTTNGATWSNGFLGVWHLDEVFGQHRDSTANRGLTRSVQAVGQGFPAGAVGGGDDFNDLTVYSSYSIQLYGGANDYVSLPNLGTNTQVTVECWANLNAVPPDTMRGLVSADPWATGITDFRCNNSLQVQAANYNGTTLTSPANSISVSNWFYAGYVMAGAGSGNFRLFLNGTNVATGTGATPCDNSDLNLAREYNGRYLNARMDEVRISNVARSTNWLWATYLNIASNTFFSSAGTVTSVGVLGTNITLNTTGNSLMLSWPADHVGWRLQVQTNTLAQGLGSNWTDVPNATTTNHLTMPIGLTNGAVFYRMIYP